MNWLDKNFEECRRVPTRLTVHCSARVPRCSAVVGRVASLTDDKRRRMCFLLAADAAVAAAVAVDAVAVARDVARGANSADE